MPRTKRLLFDKDFSTFLSSSSFPKFFPIGHHSDFHVQDLYLFTYRTSLNKVLQLYWLFHTPSFVKSNKFSRRTGSCCQTYRRHEKLMIRSDTRETTCRYLSPYKDILPTLLSSLVSFSNDKDFLVCGIVGVEIRVGYISTLVLLPPPVLSFLVPPNSPFRLIPLHR